MSRREIAKELRKQNFTYQQIAELLETTKQRVHQYITGYKPFKKFQGRDFIHERIRNRDKHTCQICGHKWQDGEKRLDVHHKDCDGKKTDLYENYEKNQHNLITLCHKCHFAIHYNRVSLKASFSSCHLPS